MKLFEIAQEIEELDGQQIHQKYYNDIPLDDYVKIVNADPKTRYPKRIGKYSKILINIFKTGQLKMEDLPKATEYLTFAYKYGVGLDIKQIKSLGDIFNMVKKYIAKESNDSSVTSKSLNPEEYDVLHKGKEWTIYTPKTEKAACYLGAGTQWCTTWGKESLNPSYKDRESYFPRYNKQGPLYIMVDRHNPEVKFQFHFESSQYMDVSDRSIKVGEFLKNNLELKYFFFPSFTKQVTEESRDEQYEKMDVLSYEDRMLLLKKTLSSDDMEKPLIRQIMVNSKNTNTYDFDFEKSEYLGDYYEQFNQSMHNLRNMKTESHMYASEYISDVEFDWNEIFSLAIKDYYEENKDNLRRKMSIYNLESFRVKYYSDFAKDDDLKDAFKDETTDKTSKEYEQDADAEIDKLEKYITVQEGWGQASGVTVSVSFLIPFIISNDISEITDENKVDVLDDFIYHYDLSNDVEIYPEIVEARYTNQDEFYRRIDNYFDHYIFNNDEEGCIELEKMFRDIRQKLFRGTSQFENDQIILKLNTYTVDCVKESVDITLYNKETDETHKGEVKVVNLPDYVQNYKLFEQVINFKRFIT